jgi:hypothetical protein
MQHKPINKKRQNTQVEKLMTLLTMMRNDIAPPKKSGGTIGLCNVGSYTIFIEA